MRKLLAAAFLNLVLIVGNNTISTAQVNISINIGSQPGWGPTGYDYVEFYYFPDFNFYYDVAKAQYLIYRNSGWYYTNSITSRYRNFDPYTAYKVVVNQKNPYLYNKAHKSKYAQYKGKGENQSLIRGSKEEKYYQSKDHPLNSQRNKTADSKTKSINNKGSNSRSVRSNTDNNGARGAQNGKPASPGSNSNNKGNTKAR